jgi:iron complex transport system ATP-binding protein
MDDIAIQFKDISVSFADHHVLNGASGTIYKGEIVTFLGRNGCGKSTLIKAITGNLVPDGGTITIDGKNVKEYSSQSMAKVVAYLPQVHEVPRDMTAYELVSCGRYPYQHWWSGVSSKDRMVIEDVMKKTNTFHLKDRRVAYLSGGERQRVWIAMALAQEPQILILDEPTTYLDICHQLEVLELVSKLNHDDKLTVVMVLHDINQSIQYSSKVMVLEEGKIEKAGDPLKILDHNSIADIFHVDADLVHQKDRIHVLINGLLPDSDPAISKH